MKFAIGSSQEAKLKAVYEGAKLHYGPISLECTGYDVSSGIPDQPFTLEQTAIGAENRARRALKSQADADMGVGLEGGLQRVGDRMLDFGVVKVIGTNGITGVGISEGIPLPDDISALVLDKGLELSEAASRVYQIEVSRLRDCPSIFTSGRLGVVKFYMGAVQTALEDYDRQVA
jgi:inosine/xanthosine triphosphatase